MMPKAPGSEVFSGAINGESALTLRASRLAVDSRYARIMNVMRDSEQQRPQLRRLGDQLGAWYTPLALGLADRGVDVERRARALPRGAGRRDAVSAAHRHPGGHHRRHLARGEAQHHHSRSRGAGTHRPMPHDRPRQDRHVDLRRADTDRPSSRAGHGRRAGAAVCREPGTILEASAGRAHSRSGSAASIWRCSTRARCASDRAKGCEGEVDGRQVRIIGRRQAEAAGLRQRLPPTATGLECVVLVDGRYAATYRFHDAPRAGQPIVHHASRASAPDRARSCSSPAIARAKCGTSPSASASTRSTPDRRPRRRSRSPVQETGRAPTLFIGDGINDAPALVTATVGLAFGHQSEITTEAAGAVIMDTVAQACRRTVSPCAPHAADCASKRRRAGWR